MTLKLEIPKRLLDLLAKSDFAGPVHDYTTKVSVVLSDNKLPFFPYYTDHGLDHIERVLTTISEQLIPNDVAEILNDTDIAVLIPAVLLHDIAMHIRPQGFLDLIHGQTAHRSVPWFGAGYAGYQRERPWKEVWADYITEVKRFNDQQFQQILGKTLSPDHLRHWLLGDFSDDVDAWTQSDYLLIGEFIRRHHGRLAHEIALYGFPGLANEDFPILRNTLPLLANLSGLVARSHSVSLRTAMEYLKHEHNGDLRPRGALVVYHMALLRVADYLQIDAKRAPRLLFKLLSTHISKTIDEWNKHGAVAHISYLHEDPSAIKIDLSQEHSLHTHIQIANLLDDLQNEMDISSAIIGEVFGTRAEGGLNRIRLNKVRIYSNHRDQALLMSLPYLPIEARLDADPKILTLMIEPLYGFFPEIAIRELLQNAIDAVLECQNYCMTRGFHTEAFEFFKQDCDVCLDLTLQEEGWVLRITDKGIGMKPETVKDYFLKAGASFRESQTWRKLFVNTEGRTTVNRTGRFGIGVFSAFLVGNSLNVTTRHIDDEHGVMFMATRDMDLIELKKADAPIGTSITIPLSNIATRWIEQHLTGETWDWFALQAPYVRRQITRGNETAVLPQRISLSPEQLQGVSTGWGLIKPEGFSGVTWGALRMPILFCNGIAIASVEAGREQVNKLNYSSYSWDDSFPFSPPLLAVYDPEGSLPLTLRRDRLSGPLPFEKELREDILLDFIAFVL